MLLEVFAGSRFRRSEPAAESISQPGSSEIATSGLVVKSLDTDALEESWALDADRPFVFDLIPRTVPLPEPRGGWKGAIKWLAAHALMPLRAGRWGPVSQRPWLYTSWGGMGDEVLHTAVLRELAARVGTPVCVLSLQPWVYRGLPFVKNVAPPDGHAIAWARKRRLLRFASYAEKRQPGRAPWLEHQIAMICDGLRLSGDIELRPEIHLTEAELERAAHYEGRMVVHSSVLGARFPSYNKQWPPERMAEVVRGLLRSHRVVQIGSADDPLLPGVEDLRGCGNLRHVAAVLARARLFVGMEGFLVHLARAVGCRSIVVYGGYTRPGETGYPCNENLYTELPCSPCWEPSGCSFKRQCLDAIAPGDVLAAVERGLGRAGQPLETHVVNLPAS